MYTFPILYNLWAALFRWIFLKHWLHHVIFWLKKLTVFPKLNLSLSTWKSGSSISRETCSSSFHLQNSQISQQTNKDNRTLPLKLCILSLLYLSFFYSKTSWENCLRSGHFLTFCPLSDLLLTCQPTSVWFLNSFLYWNYSFSWLSTISMLPNPVAPPVSSLMWPLSSVQHILLAAFLTDWSFQSLLSLLLDFRMLDSFQLTLEPSSFSSLLPNFTQFHSFKYPLWADNG